MKKQTSILISIVLSLLVLFSYQNCGTETSGSMFEKSSSYPLPYEIKVDQLAYMSCAEQLNITNDDGVFFTFRAGAYGEESGLRLTDDFLYETRRKDDHDKMEILANDMGTAFTRLQFALRQRSALHRMFLNPDSGEGTEELDYDLIFGDLGSDEMSASILTSPSNGYTNYWAAGGITKDSYFEGTMVFNGSEALAEQVRDYLSNDWALTFAYADPVDPATISTPSNYSEEEDLDGDGEADPVSTNEALGVGLKVSFKQPSGATWGYGGTNLNMPRRVLSVVDDYNLESPNSIGTRWSCPTSLQLRIVHPDDAAAEDPAAGTQQVCPVANDPSNPSEALQIVRRSLPASDWYVNLDRQCVVPKRYKPGSCYGMDTGIVPNVRRTPVYGMSSACNPDVNNGTGVCLHFVSICYRP